MTTSPQRKSLAVRAGYGLFLLSWPRLLLQTGDQAAQPGWASGVVRLLGLRHLLQARVLAAHPNLATAGAVVDVAHGLTDIGEAIANRHLRTPALIDSTLAVTLALSSLPVRRLPGHAAGDPRQNG